MCIYIYIFLYSYFIRKVKKIHGDGAKENFNNKGKLLGLLIYRNWPVN